MKLFIAILLIIPVFSTAQLPPAIPSSLKEAKGFKIDILIVGDTSCYIDSLARRLKAYSELYTLYQEYDKIENCPSCLLQALYYGFLLGPTLDALHKLKWQDYDDIKRPENRRQAEEKIWYWHRTLEKK